MPYKNNPFGSSKGDEIVENIFDLMFITDEAQPSKLNIDDKNKQVKFYKNNIINIVNKMRKFVTGYQQVPISEADSPGIHVCPHCKRRDFIYFWQLVDGGHYNNPDHWNDTVQPGQWKKGGIGERGRYCFALRFRCNNVSTCNKCHTTVNDPNHSIKSCAKCGDSTSMVQVGCGEESYGVSYLREYTMSDNFPTNMAEYLGVAQRNKQIRIKREKVVQGKFTGYELKIPPLPPAGMPVKTFQQVEQHTPYVDFTYSDKASGRDTITSYPISDMNFALSKRNLRRCKRGIFSGGYAHEGVPYYLRARDGKPLDRCPSCSASDSPTVEEVPNIYYVPDTMKIMNPQPLSGESVMPYPYKGSPVYGIYLESSSDSEYKILLPLPMVKTLRPIPNEPTINTLGRASPTCPNDVGMFVIGNEQIDEAKKQLEEAQEKLKGQLKEKFGVGPADCQTSEGFTYLVAEGRSRNARYDGKAGKWIDYSPECISYRSKKGVLLSSPRTYPRWNYVPRYADPTSTENNYLGPNPETHVIMDWNRSSNNVGIFIDSPVEYHGIVKIAELLDDDVGKTTQIFECLTCKGAVAAGGMLEYRGSKGDADRDGTAKGNFPQKVLDTELKYQNSFPLVNDKGEPVSIAWGVTTGNQDGKEMLKNPARRIRID